MIGKESIIYSLKNLNQRRARSFLTILSIFVGIATIFIFISFGFGLYNYVNEFTTGGSADKIIIQPKGSGAPGLDDTFSLSDDDLRVIEKTSGVFEATGASFKVGEVAFRGENKFVFVNSYDPKKPLIFELSSIGLDKGRWLQGKDSKKAILGYNYQLEDKVFSKAIEVNDKIELNDVDVKVVGFLESVGNPQDDASIYITNDYFNELYDQNTSYGWVIARVNTEDIDSTIENVEKNLRKHRDLEEGQEDFFVQSFQELLESFSSALNIVVGFVILIALVSILVSTINTANTMITSVLERYKEIGILKAIGAKNSEIFKIFLFESSFLGLLAGTIGVLLGYGLTSLAGALLDNLGFGFLSPFYSYELFLGLILFAGLTGAISGVIPALRASKTNTVDALRYE